MPGASAMTMGPDKASNGPADPQQLNRFSYVSNNPVKNTDPTGHCPTCVGAAIGAAVGATAYLLNESQQKDGIDLHLNISIDKSGFHLDAGSDWGDLAVATGSGAISGAMIATPGLGLQGVGLGMASNLVGDEVGNLITGSDFSATNHIISGVTGSAAGALGSLTVGTGEMLKMGGMQLTALKAAQAGMVGVLDTSMKAIANKQSSLTASDLGRGFASNAASEVIGIGWSHALGDANEVFSSIHAQTTTTFISSMYDRDQANWRR